MAKTSTGMGGRKSVSRSAMLCSVRQMATRWQTCACRRVWRGDLPADGADSFEEGSAGKPCPTTTSARRCAIRSSSSHARAPAPIQVPPSLARDIRIEMATGTDKFALPRQQRGALSVRLGRCRCGGTVEGIHDAVRYGGAQRLSAAPASETLTACASLARLAAARRASAQSCCAGSAAARDI